MEIASREGLVSETISRVINNAPINEILRVYSVAVRNELDKMSDEDLVSSIQNAGYADLIEKYVDSEE